MSERIDKRRHSRTKLKGYIADVADGHFVYDGIVEDISIQGLRLVDLSDRFVVENRNYNLVVSGGPDSLSFKLKVTPRWKKVRKYCIDVGFHIVDAPSSWKKFVQQRLLAGKKNKDEEDVWEQFSGSSLG
ncbi:MAG: PilZ domain-containing protein [Candidatus Electrothrix sp. EH2]|nr:PilZ domain-containing protein [Candidatus Electrothrix sp. EH2]